jgi:predicted ATPase/class 3 adenylate cyclase
LADATHPISYILPRAGPGGGFLLTADWSPTDRGLLQSLLPAPLVDSLTQRVPPDQAVAEASARLDAALVALVPFVPAPVRDIHLAQDTPTRIPGLYLTGTVLSADLSGFTALSSELAAAGRQGSEEISALINRLFAVLVEEVEAHGGGVIQFGGDGLTAFFDAARLGGAHPALASAAALAMQARMDAFSAVPTSKGPFRLQVRIAVHTGKLFAAEVGDADHTELIVTGRVINRVELAQESAAPGEVIITANTLEALGHTATERRATGLYLLRGLDHRPPLPAAARPAWQPGPPSPALVRALVHRIQACRPFVPHGLPDRFLGTDAEGGEFRPVTVLFASFYAFRELLALLEGLTLLEDDVSIVGRVLDAYYTRSQAVIHQYGGSVNKVDMATFGNRLLALFGAPAAHDDDPTLAVQAALALQAAFDAADVEVARLLHEWTEGTPEGWSLLRMIGGEFHQRVGIAGGPVFAGIIGTPARHEYTVMGETVNLAARILEAAGDGDVLLTSRTRREVRHWLETEPLPPLQLKGLQAPMPVFRAVQERAGSSGLRWAVPLLGREAELTRLLEAGETALRGGQGRVIALVGEPGIGKSRLLDEALREIGVRVPACEILHTTCQSHEQAIPHAPVGRLLRQALLPAPVQDIPTQVAALRGQLDVLVPEWSRFLPLLGPLLNLPLADTPLTAALTPEQRRARLHDLIVMAFLALARRRSLVLAIDDLQWVDASSHALLARLAAEPAGYPLLLLLVYRPVPDLTEPWQALPHATGIALRPLTTQDSAALLQAWLGGPAPPEIEPLIARADGTPLFMEETVRYLIESGALTRNGAGEWIATRPVDSATIPAHVEQLLIARLDRLDEDTRTLAQIAAVIGVRFSEPILAALIPLRRSLRHGLDALIAAAIIQPDEGAVPATYQFKHPLLRDVAYSSLLFARRRTLHAQIAAALEQVYPGEMDTYRVMLAQHYQLAGQEERAFAHFLTAARQAQARDAHREAVELYTQALAVAPWAARDPLPADLDAAAPLYECLGDVLDLTGDYPAARAQYQQLAQLLETSSRPDHRIRQAMLLRKISGTYEHQGDLEQALSRLARAEDMVAGAPDPAAVREHAGILSDMGWVHFRQSHWEQAQEFLERALALIAGLPAYAEQARIHNRLGGVAWARGALDRAQHYVEQSLAAARQSGDLVAQARAFNNLGLITESQGLPDDAIRYGLQAMDINEQSGSRRDLAIAAITVGYAYYDREDYAQARTYFSRALALAAEVHDRYAQMQALLNLGRVLSALAEWDAATVALSQSRAIAEELQIPAVALDVWTALGEIALHRGDMAEAAQAHQQAQALAGDPDSEEYGRFQRLTARIAAAQGDRQRAHALLADAEALFTRLQNVPEATRTHKLAAILAPPPADTP